MARAEHDYYPTPPWAVRSLLEKRPDLLELPGPWLEPAAGRFDLIKVAREYAPDSEWCAMDLVEYAEPPAGVEFSLGDFREFPWPESDEKMFGLCLMNPPFKHADDFLKRCVRVSQVVASIIRPTLIQATTRTDWIRSLRPSYYPMPHKFRWHGSEDMFGRCWIVFDGRGEFELLPNVPSKEREDAKQYAGPLDWYEDGR